MPGYNRSAGTWLGEQLAQTKRDVAALKQGGTEYIIDEAGVCRAIIGHLIAEPDGTSTGLSGWGVAVLASGTWIALSTVEITTHKGAANGYAPLDANEHVPVANLPLTRGLAELPVSGKLEVEHGLGVVPVAIVLTPYDVSAPVAANLTVSAKSSTKFTVLSSVGSLDFFWIATA